MAQISGGNAPERLVGTPGADVITAGAGDDVIVFDGRGGPDVLTDFGAIYFGGPVTGAQESPPVSSAASGSVLAWLNRPQTELNFVSVVTGLDFGGQTAATSDNVSASHFHASFPGTSGGVVFGFIGAPNNELTGETTVNVATGVVTGSWDLNEGNNTTLAAQLTNLLTGRIYINFHTPVAPAGEIRGQLNVLDGGGDRIDVSGLGVSDFATLQPLMSEVNGSAIISLTYNGAAHSLTLQGVPLARLSAADFIFATSPGGGAVGSEGADQLIGTSGGDTILAGSGDDRVNSQGGADYVEGGDGADTIQGLDGADSLRGGAGADDVNGNTGQDWVFGEDGADTVRGGQDNDTVEGGAGADPHVNGNLGADLVFGGDDNDTVFGGQGTDTLYGDGGADWLSGDLGNDILFGGGGADRFLFRPGSGADWVADFNFADGDRIQLATATPFTVGAFSGQVVLTLASGDAIGLVGIAAGTFNGAWVVFG
jgi:Ca2+-binding RTX toxin-like protein